MKKALLVLDMQNVTVGENHAEFFKYDREQLIGKVNQVIEENADSVVVYIRNMMKKNLLNRFAPVQVYEGTKEAELAKDLRKVSDYVFDKYKGDAFSNPEFVDFLKSQNVDEVEVIGVDGGGCVALTALGAVKNGYHVTVNTQAVGTMFVKNRDKYFAKLRDAGASFI